MRQNCRRQNKKRREWREGGKGGKFQRSGKEVLFFLRVCMRNEKAGIRIREILHELGYPLPFVPKYLAVLKKEENEYFACFRIMYAERCYRCRYFAIAE